MTKASEINNADEFELKSKLMVLCWSLKRKLDVLSLEMERYGETNVRRYDNLCSYLNSDSDFDGLPAVKTVTRLLDD